MNENTNNTNPKDDVVRDAQGRPIPDGELTSVFAATKQYADTVAYIGRLIVEVNSWAKEPAGAFLSTQSVQLAGDNFKSLIAVARPYVVCPSCDGTKLEGGPTTGEACKLCRADGKAQGWLPHWKWRSLSAELKAKAKSFQETITATERPMGLAEQCAAIIKQRALSAEEVATRCGLDLTKAELLVAGTAEGLHIGDIDKLTEGLGINWGIARTDGTIIGTNAV